MSEKADYKFVYTWLFSTVKTESQKFKILRMRTDILIDHHDANMVFPGVTWSRTLYKCLKFTGSVFCMNIIF